MKITYCFWIFLMGLAFGAFIERGEGLALIFPLIGILFPIFKILED